MQKTETNSSKLEDKIIHDFESRKDKGIARVVIILVFAVLLGLGMGFIFSRNKSITQGSSLNSNSSSVSKGNVYGSNDLSTFKDMATGKLEKGGIEGEGQFHLVRPGGDSQNVYLTSSLVDLSLFVGKQIKVNGQTQTAKKAGWLMDVGRVEVIQ